MATQIQINNPGPNIAAKRGAIIRDESNANLGMNSESIFNDEDYVETLRENEVHFNDKIRHGRANSQMSILATQ